MNLKIKEKFDFFIKNYIKKSFFDFIFFIHTNILFDQICSQISEYFIDNNVKFNNLKINIDDDGFNRKSFFLKLLDLIDNNESKTILFLYTELRFDQDLYFFLKKLNDIDLKNKFIIIFIYKNNMQIMNFAKNNFFYIRLFSKDLQKIKDNNFDLLISNKIKFLINNFNKLCINNDIANNIKTIENLLINKDEFNLSENHIVDYINKII